MRLTFPLVAVRRLAFRLKVSFQVVLSFAVLALWLAGGSLAEAQTVSFAGAVTKLANGFSQPSGVAVDAQGDVFIADTGHNAVREIVAVNGLVSSSSTLKTLSTQFSEPYGVAVDAQGDVFVADSGENAVKEIVAVNGVASSSSQVNIVGSGFTIPEAVAVDALGDVFVADTYGHAVKEIVAVDGSVSSSSTVKVVGSGAFEPAGVAVDANGDVFFADLSYKAVKEIVAVNGAVSTSSQVKTVGSGFVLPYRIALDAAGDVFVADSSAHEVKEIVAVSGAVSASSQVNILGNGFVNPEGVGVNAQGQVFVADQEFTTLEEIQLGPVNFSSVAVGSSSTVTFTFNFTAGGTIQAPKVLTQGLTGLDFTDAGTGSCTTNGTTHSYSAGDSCTVAVQFKPTTPGVRQGAVELFASDGTTPLVTLPVYGTGTGPLVSFPSTSAGTALGGGFELPQAVALDGAGNVYVADYDSATLKVVPFGCASSSCVTTLGSGFEGPTGIALDGGGNVYVADYRIGLLRLVPAGCTSSSCVTTLDGGFLGPFGVTVDGAGNAYVADYNAGAVKVVPSGCTSSRCVRTLGGGFTGPRDIALDSTGNIYVADTDANAVKEMPPGCASSSCVTTLASNLNAPGAVSVDAAGDIYVGNSGAGTIIEIPAGCGNPSCQLTLGSGFEYPVGVALDKAGNLFVADRNVSRVKTLGFATPPSVAFATSTTDGATDSTDGTKTVTLANIGNQSLSLEAPSAGNNPSVPTGFSLAAAPTACPVISSGSSAQMLRAGQSCTLGIGFAPVTPQSGTVSGSVVVTDNSLNVVGPSYTTQAIPVSGTAISPADTTQTTLTPRYSSVGSGQADSLAVTVVDTTHTGTVPTGSVSFTDTFGGTTTTVSGSPQTLSDGTVTLLVTLTGDGVHTLTATYAGVSGSFMGSSNTANITVGTATHYSVTAVSPEYEGSGFTVTVTALDANNQTATLYSGTAYVATSDPLGSVTPSETVLTAGVGTVTVTLESPGTRTILATDTVNSSITGSATVSVQAPPTYTVTVATDTTTGVAANCTANSTTDPNCSLRDALAAAAASSAPSSTIRFSATTFPATNTTAQNTITLGNAGALTVPNNTTIQGLTTGSGASLANLVTVSGNNATNIFLVPMGVMAEIENLTLTAGSATGSASGGAINNSGSLTLNQDTVSNNSSSINSGGGVSNSGALTVTNSTFTGNMAPNGGAIFSSGPLFIGNSTFTGNTAVNKGGAIYYTTASSAIGNITVTGNTAGTGGGVYFLSGAASALLESSIVEANTATTSYADLYGTFRDPAPGLYNESASPTSNLTTASLGLAALGSYGGPTQTMPVLPTSLAFCTATAGPEMDQRGVSRAAYYGTAHCNDVGATNSSYSLVFTTQPSSSYPVGANFTTTPVVSFEDNGFVLPFTTTGAPITLTDHATAIAGSQSYNFTAGSFTPTTTRIASPESSDTLTATYTLLINSVPLAYPLSAMSNSFAVVNPLTAFAISTLSNVTAGTPQSVTVTAKNGSGTSTGFTGTVTFTSTDSQAGLPSSYTFTTADAGVHTFTNGVTFKTAGLQTITVTSGSVSQTSNSVLVTAGAPATITATAGTPQSAATGAAFATPLAVQVLDAYGNPASGQTVTFTAPASGAGATLASATCQTGATGSCSVTATANATPGNYTVTATIGALSVNFALTNVGPASYTVTVATDTTNGVAANCTVNAATATPDPNCSLRDAIAAATALNVPSITPTIQFASALTSSGPATITEGSAGTLTLAANMNIVGPGQTLLAIDGANLYEVMAVNSGVTAAISGVTVQHGNNPNGGAAAGGIYNAGTLTVTNSSIVHNSTIGSGGGLASLIGSLTLVGCNVANNSAYDGAGVFSQGGPLAITGSSISGNSTVVYSPLLGGAGVWQIGSTVSISDSTISGNSSPFGSAGGLFLDGATGTLTNVTMSGNSAKGFAGGIFNYRSSLTLIQTTIAGNSSQQGGGIFNDGALALVLTNSVVAGNTATTSYPNIQSGIAITDNGGNVFDTTSTSNLSPNLAPLGNYGGPTQTQPALPGSPVLCAGLVSNVGGVTTDQRGNPRIATYGANQCVDSGAVQTAYSLSFSTQPSNTETTVAISPAPAVVLEDNGVANGITGASISVALANGTLNGTATETTDATGTAIFAGLSVPTPETGDTLTASVAAGTNIVTATSNPFNVLAVDHLGIAVPSAAVAGTPFNATVTAYLDQAGTTVATGYTGPITLTSTDPAAVLPGSTNLTAGLATISVTLKTAGNQTISAQDASGSPSGTSAPIAVGASTAASVSIVSGNNQSATVNTAFALPLIVVVKDQYGNAVGSATVTATAPVSSSPSATFGSIAATDSNGQTSISATANSLYGGPYTVSVGSGSSTAATFSLTNNAAQQTIMFPQPASPLTYTSGLTTTLTATASSGLTVTYRIVSGTASVTGSTVTYSGPGAVVVEADQAGNSTYAAATAVQRMITVNANPTIAFAIPNHTYGDAPFTVAATSNSTGAFTYSLVSGNATVTSAGLVTITGTGSVTVMVSQAASGYYLAATQNATFNVASATPAISFSIPNHTYGDAPFSVAATSNSTGAFTYSLVSGNATVSPAGLVTLTGAGPVVVLASEAADSNYVAGTKQASFTVAAGTPTIGFSIPNHTYGDPPFTVAATSNSTGAFTYSLVSGNATVSPAGLVTLTGDGTIVVLATEASDSNFVAATKQASFSVAMAQLTVSANNATRVYGAPNPAFTGTVTGAKYSDSFTETFSTSATTTSVPGPYSIVPSVAGSDLSDYTVATVNGTLTIAQAPSTTALSVSSTTVNPNQTVTLTALVSSTTTGTPTGSVTFSDNGNALQTVALASGSASYTTLLSPGTTHTLTASYAGDTNFLPSASSAGATTITVAPLDFTFSFTGENLTVAPGKIAVYSFAVSPLYGSYAGPITFSVTGLPPGATAVFSPANLPASSGPQTVTLSVQTAASTASREHGPRGWSAKDKAPAILAALLLPLFGFRRLRELAGRRVIMLLLAIGGLGAVATLSGCGSGTGFGTQEPQTYTLTVTATSGTLVHTSTVNLTVQ